MHVTIRFLLLLLMSGYSLICAAQPRESVEGVHYQALEITVPTETDADRIEVREIFWSGCSECFTLEPIMSDWGEGVRGDLILFRMPAIWNEVMALHAKIYYTAIAVNDEDRIHRAAFHTIHEENNPLRTETQIRDFFMANNIDSETFNSAWNSEEVASALQQASVRTSDYGIDKLPSIIVNGRFKITHNEKVFNHIEMNIAVNLVVRHLRDERRSDF
jgi:protein dithiol oxidoreductase (disulfide-forming)